MNSFRKVIGVLLAMSFVAFTLPAIGASSQPTKKYRLAVVVPPDPTTVIVYVANSR